MSKMPTNYYSMIDTINKRCVAAPLTGKEYQRKGVEWCIEREREPTTGFIKGGLVADEMGLGKTLTMIMVLLLNYKANVIRSSTKYIISMVRRDLQIYWS